uniref:Uncharacterized protein n=1 Tax=Panagrolaimus sp. PS1159 TaxID=55785 RepID=A0AC35GFD9_9BILA
MSTIHSFKLYNQFTLSETEKDQADGDAGDDHPIILAENEVSITLGVFECLPGGDSEPGDNSAKHLISVIDEIVTLDCVEISNAGDTKKPIV